MKDYPSASKAVTPEFIVDEEHIATVHSDHAHLTLTNDFRSRWCGLRQQFTEWSWPNQAYFGVRNPGDVSHCWI
jgi:hypothetical protein